MQTTHTNVVATVTDKQFFSNDSKQCRAGAKAPCVNQMQTMFVCNASGPGWAVDSPRFLSQLFPHFLRILLLHII